MKRLLVLAIALFAFSSLNAQTLGGQPTKDQVHANFRTDHPDEDIYVTSTDEENGGFEEYAAPDCFEIGWIELPGGCVGYTRYCHHHFLFWSWWTETDHHVSCP